MIRAYIRDGRGAAAVEFALVLGVFTLAIPSVVDLGIYAYDAMQVRNSAQMGVQALWAACTQLPATNTTACPNGQAAMNAAVARTSLGTGVSATVAEGYFCGASGGLVNASGTSVGNFTTALDSAVTTQPTTCPSGSTTTAPGDYISVTTTYTYTPVFSQVSVASLLSTSIQSTAWMRLL